MKKLVDHGFKNRDYNKLVALFKDNTQILKKQIQNLN